MESSYKEHGVEPSSKRSRGWSLVYKEPGVESSL